MAFFAQSALAADDGIYMGGGLGVGTAAIQNLTTGVSTVYTSSGGRLIGGYQFNKNFAIEGEYVNLGTFTDPTLAVDATSYGIGAVGSLPLGSSQTFSLYGKIGMSSTTTKAKAAAGYVLTVPADQTKSGVSVGMGLNIDVSPKMAVRISLDSYQYGVGNDAISGRMAFWGVNGVFRF